MQIILEFVNKVIRERPSVGSNFAFAVDRGRYPDQTICFVN